MKDRVYKVFTESEWKAFEKTGKFEGSADDLRDGFIHLSTKEQLAGVIQRFFPGIYPLYIAEFSASVLNETLKWEVSASNEVYPHLYGVGLFATEITSLETVTK